jgi:hypothetical protein
MKRGGIGVGSASIVLIFATLCLAIFTVVSLLPALTEQVLIEAEIQFVTDFYAADTVAEQVLAEILYEIFQGEPTPPQVLGIEVFSYWNWDFFAEIISFRTPVTDYRGLYVVVAFYGDFYEILTWQMYSLVDWTPDDRLNVWQGEFDFVTGW